MSTTWWTDKKINATVTREYIIGRLGPRKQIALHRPLAFGDGLTDDTYLDWILQRGRRLFLIFEDIGIPEWIFEAVDRSFDDNDLPLAEEQVWDLNLSHSTTNTLDKKFHRRQFHYLVHDLSEGCHVDYEPEEIIPVETVAKKTNPLSNQNIDGVYIKDKLCTRRRVPLGKDNGVDRIHFILYLKALQKLKHNHLITVFATYTHLDYGCILLVPSVDLSLKSLLEDPPKHFKALSKDQRRESLIRWVTCLTSAVTYLHESGYAHEAIRPANIFITTTNKICLGPCATLDLLDDKRGSYDRESYDYGSPEQWIRTPSFQETAAPKTTGHGGGRSVRRLPKAPQRAAETVSPLSPLLPSVHRPPMSKVLSAPAPVLRTQSSKGLTAAAPKATRSRSQSESNNSNSSISSKNKKTLITTFAQERPTSLPSDVFSLSCILLDLLTAVFSPVCGSSTTSNSLKSSKFTIKAFATFRGKKNRQAGRGGALPDSSFHANLSQVTKWNEKLSEEAWGKEGSIWRVVAELGETVVRAGLKRDGELRWKARDGDRVAREVVDRWLGTGLKVGDIPCCTAYEVEVQEHPNGGLDKEEQPIHLGSINRPSQETDGDENQVDTDADDSNSMAVVDQADLSDSEDEGRVMGLSDIVGPLPISALKNASHTPKPPLNPQVIGMINARFPRRTKSDRIRGDSLNSDVIGAFRPPSEDAFNPTPTASLRSPSTDAYPTSTPTATTPTLSAFPQPAEFPTTPSEFLAPSVDLDSVVNFSRASSAYSTDTGLGKDVARDSAYSEETETEFHYQDHSRKPSNHYTHQASRNPSRNKSTNTRPATAAINRALVTATTTLTTRPPSSSAFDPMSKKHNVEFEGHKKRQSKQSARSSFVPSYYSVNGVTAVGDRGKNWPLR
ncbi:hypothetical protein MMC09_000418 [Bachmanniomyces sp. S44760]|nr:hypothetical protein [Bachmanniomyces sp. S44760]